MTSLLLTRTEIEADYQAAKARRAGASVQELGHAVPQFILDRIEENAAAAIDRLGSEPAEAPRPTPTEQLIQRLTRITDPVGAYWPGESFSDDLAVMARTLIYLLEGEAER